MQRSLILFASREGQTEKVAIRISERLKKMGLSVQLVNAADATATSQIDLSRYDLLIFGASMHAGGLEREIVEFVNANVHRIESKTKSFFLVLLSAATKDPELKTKSLADAQRKMNRQLMVEFGDIEMIAGVLAYSKYPWPLQWLMKRIAAKAGEGTDTSQDYEYTDWEQVSEYAVRLGVLLDHP